MSIHTMYKQQGAEGADLNTHMGQADEGNGPEVAIANGKRAAKWMMYVANKEDSLVSSR